MDALLQAHFPGLQLDEPEWPLAGGLLRALPFAEWHAVDGTFADAQRQYERSQPVFWCIRFEFDEAEVATQLPLRVNELLWPVHTAFLLDEWVPLLPTPALSCSYVSLLSAESGHLPVLRLIGPLEREFIVFGSPLSYRYDGEHLADVDARATGFTTALTSVGTRLQDNELAAALNVLEETSRPDSWYYGDARIWPLHGFVRCMAAAESLLLPPESERQPGEITQSFARRAAALLSTSCTVDEDMEKRCAELYRFRSSLVHGRDLPAENDRHVREQLDAGRKLLRSIICAALDAQDAVAPYQPLSMQLENRIARSSGGNE